MYALPADRVTTWNPGFYPVGGIPANSNIFTTLTPLGPGQDDLPQIKAALDNSGAVGKVVLLGPGTFLKFGTDPIWLWQSNTRLRGSGRGTTTISCVVGQDGNGLGLTPGMEIPRPPGNGSDGTYVGIMPAILIGPQRYLQGPGDEAFSRNLAANAVKGQTSVALIDVTGLAVGDFVVLDELSGASWQPDPQGGGAQVWARPDYQVIWRKHLPERQDYFKMADFTGSIAGTTLTVNTATITGQINIPSILSGTGIPSGTELRQDLGGGNYQLDRSLTVASQAMHAEQFPYEPNSNGDFYCRLDRPLCEVKEISAIAGNTVTFNTPFHRNYSTAFTAQITKYKMGAIKNTGIEDLSIRGATGTGVLFQDAAYCWAKNVESHYWAYNPNFNITRGFRCHVLSCDSRDCVYPRNAAGSYSLCLNWATSDSIYEDCVSVDCDKVTLVRAAGRACVYAYCHVDRGFIDAGQHWCEVGLNASHFCGSSHVLFEGCKGFNADSDFTAGPSNNITWFRNHLAGTRTPYTNYFVSTPPTVYDDATDTQAGPMRCAGLQATTYWCSFVGNVLGVAGQMAGWVYETDYAYPTSNRQIYYIGWDNGTDVKMKDLAFAGHIIRAGNFDHLTSSQKWEDGTVADTLPDSLFLSAAPAWWPTSRAATPWPPYDPTTGATTAIPATARDAGYVPPPNGGGGGPVEPPFVPVDGPGHPGSASVPLQKAIYDALLADATVTSLVGNRVYDRAPANATMPYITIGPSDIVPATAIQYDGSNERIQIDGWSIAVGKVEAKRIGRAIRDALDGAPLVLDENQRLVDIMCDQERYLTEADGLTSHAVVIFIAYTEPTA